MQVVSLSLALLVYFLKAAALTISVETRGRDAFPKWREEIVTQRLFNSLLFPGAHSGVCLWFCFQIKVTAHQFDYGSDGD